MYGVIHFASVEDLGAFLAEFGKHGSTCVFTVRRDFSADRAGDVDAYVLEFTGGY